MRLLKRLAADADVPRGVRIRMALLLVYLALPIDLIPDFIPVLGYADDAILVALVLRSATVRAGPEVIAKHWPGTPDGLAALRQLCGAVGVGLIPQTSHFELSRRTRQPVNLVTAARTVATGALGIVGAEHAHRHAGSPVEYLGMLCRSPMHPLIPYWGQPSNPGPGLMSTGPDPLSAGGWQPLTSAAVDRTCSATLTASNGKAFAHGLRHPVHPPAVRQRGRRAAVRRQSRGGVGKRRTVGCYR